MIADRGFREPLLPLLHVLAGIMPPTIFIKGQIGGKLMWGWNVENFRDSKYNPIAKYKCFEI